jgi:cytoskeletal protein RodZ
MPLDFGANADSTMAVRGAGSQEPGLQGELPPLMAGANIGQALKALREAQGLSLEDIAHATCIRRAYLKALEDMALDQLPSRPFAIGYVRAFAQTLGEDGEKAVARFKDYAPPPEQALKPPVGVRKERDPRLSWLAGAAVIVITAVVIWNLAQHAVAHDGGPTPPVPVTNAPPPAPLAAGNPVTLGQAEPAPADSDVPTRYVTPGMAKGPDGKSIPVAPAKPAVLSSRAAVYGAPASQTVLTVQAQKPATLVIRGAGGSIYFARQLKAGESYRAPSGVGGLTIDVSDPQAFNVIIHGQSQGPLTAAQTPISKITAKAPAPQANTLG